MRSPQLRSVCGAQQKRGDQEERVGTNTTCRVEWKSESIKKYRVGVVVLRHGQGRIFLASPTTMASPADKHATYALFKDYKISGERIIFIYLYLHELYIPFSVF